MKRRGGTGVIATVVAMLVFASTALAVTETRSYQADAGHHGYVYGAGVVAPLTKAWSRNLGWANHYFVADGGRTFAVARVNGSATLEAIDLPTGSVDWSRSLGVSEPTDATLAVGDGDVFLAYAGVYPAGSDNAAIIVSSYRESTGAPLHSDAFTSESFPTPMILSGGNLYFEGDGWGAYVYALRQSNLASLWNTSLATADAPVSLAGSTLVVAGVCGQAAGLNQATGATIWQDNPGCSGGGGTMSSVVNGNVWGDDWSIQGGRIYRATNGAVLGQYTGYSPASGYGEAVQAVGSTSNGALSLRAFNPSTNATNWTFAEPGASGNPLGSAPLLADGYVFAEGSTGTVWALNPCTGTVAWQGNSGSAAPGLGSDPLAGLAAGDGYLVVPTATGIAAFKGAGQPPAAPPNCS